MPDTITLAAPAKINLHLVVRGRRKDGYHLLDTSFAFVDLCDELRCRPLQDSDLRVRCSQSQLSGKHNLVYRVLSRFREQHGVQQGMQIHIDKRIPVQAGLGGGSSDAATALLAANHMWNVHLNRQQLIEFAAPFGADIPCFLFGEASHAQGIGEQLSPYPEPLPSGTVLLAHPGAGLSTAAVFAEYDTALTPQNGTDTMRTPPLGENDLLPAAKGLLPAISKMLDAIEQQAERAWMSGSGSCCIGIFPDRGQAEACARMLKEGALAQWTYVGSLLRKHPVDLGG